MAKTLSGSIRTPKVILPVNGLIENFGNFTRQLAHIFTWASMSRALSTDECSRLGGQADWRLTPADPVGSNVRRIPRPDGDHIVVRNRFTFKPTMIPSLGT